MLLLLIFVQQALLSEIMFNPNGSEHHNEFVEVYNASQSDSLSLEGFYITDDSGVDKLSYMQGLRKIPPLGYGVIMDRSYFGNSTFYNVELEAGFAVFVVADNSIGSSGLSNSSPEKISLLDSNMNLLDSITYSNSAEGGFSFERRQNFGGDWRFSLRENGSIGQRNTVDIFIESIHASATFLQSEKVLRLKFVNDAHSTRQFRANVLAEFAKFANSNYSEEFTFSQDYQLLVDGRDSIVLSTSIPQNLLGQYQLRVQVLVDTTIVLEDTSRFIAIEDKFPLWISYLKLESPQFIELTNKAGFDIRIENINLQGSGGFKEIVINKDLANGEAIRISKHSSEADVFAEDIPYLYTKNGALRLAWMGLADSIKYSVNDLAFANLAISLLPSAYAGYNHKTIWRVNANRKSDSSEMPRAFLLEAKPNPFSPNGDGHEDQLEVKLNYNEFDLVDLKIYTMYGQHVKTITEDQFRAIGSWEWNGKDRSGKKLNDGVYILLFKGKGKKSGKSITKKFPIVLVN